MFKHSDVLIRVVIIKKLWLIHQKINFSQNNLEIVTSENKGLSLPCLFWGFFIITYTIAKWCIFIYCILLQHFL